MFGREFQLTGGTYRRQLHYVLANEDHTEALLHVTASRAGKDLDMDYAIVFRISEEQITEGWVLTADPQVYDEFWS